MCRLAQRNKDVYMSMATWNNNRRCRSPLNLGRKIITTFKWRCFGGWIFEMKVIIAWIIEAFVPRRVNRISTGSNLVMLWNMFRTWMKIVFFITFMSFINAKNGFAVIRFGGYLLSIVYNHWKITPKDAIFPNTVVVSSKTWEINHIQHTNCYGVLIRLT